MEVGQVVQPLPPNEPCQLEVLDGCKNIILFSAPKQEIILELQPLVLNINACLVCHLWSSTKMKRRRNKWAVKVFFHMTSLTPESDWYTPGDPISHFKMLNDSLTCTGPVPVPFDTSVNCLKARTPFTLVQLRVSALNSKNKIWQDEIKTSFLNIL